MRVIDTSSWAKRDDWVIAPDGLDWIDPGSRIICADGAPVASIVTPWKTFAEIPLHLLKVE